MFHQGNYIYLKLPLLWMFVSIRITGNEVLSTTATDGVSLSSSIMEVVENFGLEENIVVITSDGGGNITVCR